MVCVYNWLYRLCLQMVISFVFTNSYFVCVNKWLYRMCLQLVISFVFTNGYIVLPVETIYLILKFKFTGSCLHRSVQNKHNANLNMD